MRRFPLMALNGVAACLGCSAAFGAGSLPFRSSIRLNAVLFALIWDYSAGRGERRSLFSLLNLRLGLVCLPPGGPTDYAVRGASKLRLLARSIDA